MVGPIQRKPFHDGEEALVGGVLAQSTIQGNESGLIFGDNGTDPDADTLLEGDLSFEFSRIFTRKPTVEGQNRLLCLRDPRA
jgi:hypothetical protein